MSQIWLYALSLNALYGIIASFGTVIATQICCVFSVTWIEIAAEVVDAPCHFYDANRKACAVALSLLLAVVLFAATPVACLLSGMENSVLETWKMGLSVSYDLILICPVFAVVTVFTVMVTEIVKLSLFVIAFDPWQNAHKSLFFSKVQMFLFECTNNALSTVI